MNKTIRSFPLLILLTLFISSCFSPIDSGLMLIVTDELDPGFSISEPLDGSYYAGNVIVSGTVTDLISEEGEEGEIVSLSWSIEPSYLTGDSVPIENDGSFTFSFSTDGFSGTVLLTLTAEDENGNIGTKTITLYRSDNDIPSLSASAGNEAITITWDDVPLATSYTLYYTTDGSQPGEFYGESVSNVASPFILGDLENGAEHVFQLRAHQAEDDDFSGYVSSIPLSPFSLKPTLEEGAGMIKLYWPSISGTDEFTVLRSESSDGPYINISGTNVGSSFEDRSVQEGQVYWYKVRPASSEDVDSYTESIGVSPFVRSFEKANVSLAGTVGEGFAISGNYAFVASDTYGLIAVDISDPTDPAVLSYGSSGNSSNVTAIEISGNYAYVTDYTGKFLIYDISNPSSLQLVRTVDSLGSPSDIAIDGNYAYLASYTAGVEAIDISTPGAAYRVDNINLGTAVWSVEVFNGTLYAGRVGYVSTVNISNPLSLAADDATWLNIGGSVTAFDMEIQGDYIYLDQGNGGFRILDISTPSSPSQEYFNDPGATEGVQLIGDFVAVPHADGIMIINNEDPTDPYLVKEFFSSGWGYDTHQFGDYLFFLSTGYLVSYNISVLQPVLSQNDSGLNLPIAGFADDSVVLYDNASTGGVQVYSGSRYPFGNLRESFLSGMYALDVAIGGDYYFAGTFTDIRMAHSGESDMVIDAGIDQTTLELNGEYLYSAFGGAGVAVMRVNDTSSVVVDTVIDLSQSYQDLKLRGDYLYLTKANWADGDEVTIYDISDPEDALRIHHAKPYNDDTFDWDYVTLNDRYAILTDNGHINLYDIDLYSDERFYDIPTRGTANGLVLALGKTLLCGTDQGIEFVDISDPSAPMTLRTISLTSQPVNMNMRGDYLIVHDMAGDSWAIEF